MQILSYIKNLFKFKHPLFWSDWYTCKYLSYDFQIDPYLHYLEIGASLGYNPNPFFDSSWYQSRYSEVSQQKLNPLSHFIKKGSSLNYDPHPLFDSQWYQNFHTYFRNKKRSPLEHYLSAGYLEGKTTIDYCASLGGLKIAVLIRVVDRSALESTLSWLENIPIEFDLYVGATSKELEMINSIIRKKYSNAEFFECNNFEDNLVSFLDYLGERKASEFNAICHLESKEDVLHSGYYNHLLFTGVLGSRNLVKKILTCYLRDNMLSVVGIDRDYTLIDQSESLAANARSANNAGFFNGSVFWTRPNLFIKFVEILKSTPREVSGSYETNNGKLIFGTLPFLTKQRIGLTLYESMEITPLHMDISFQPIDLKISIEQTVKDHERKIQRFNSRSPKIEIKSSVFENPQINPNNLGILISVIVPVFNTDPSLLEECILSVVNQTYTNWELCICDDSSTNQGTVEVLEKFSVDSRIKIIRSDSNLHIAKASNLAVSTSSGEFIAFLDHDDLLHGEALAELALCIHQNQTVDLLYTDEDKIDYKGLYHSQPFFKPDWSLELLMSNMYILHILVIRRSLFNRIGGFRSECTGSQDYDLVLRAAPLSRKICHIPSVLYHWRQIPGSTAMDAEAKPYAKVSQKRALSDAIMQTGRKAHVIETGYEGTYHIDWTINGTPSVTLLILTDYESRLVEGRGKLNLLQNLISSIQEQSTYQNYHILVVDSNNGNGDNKIFLSNTGVDLKHFISSEAPNFSSKMNFAFSQVKTNHVICLHDDVEVISKKWIEELLQFTQNTEIGIVGSHLFYANNETQHAGIVLLDSGPGYVFQGLPKGHIGYAGHCNTIRNYLSVSGGVMATRMDVINEIGGYDNLYSTEYGDVDFNLKAGERGYRIVYTPYCEMYHFEATYDHDKGGSNQDLDYFLKKWHRLTGNDPYYNKNLPKLRAIQNNEPNTQYTIQNLFLPYDFYQKRYSLMPGVSHWKSGTIKLKNNMPLILKKPLKKIYSFLRKAF